MTLAELRSDLAELKDRLAHPDLALTPVVERSIKAYITHLEAAIVREECGIAVPAFRH